MLYKNISDKAKIALVHMVKKRVQPGETIIMTSSDIRHLGSNMAYFEPVSVSEQEVVKVEKTPAKTITKEETVVKSQPDESAEGESESETESDNEANQDENTAPVEVEPDEDTEHSSDEVDSEEESEQQ